MAHKSRNDQHANSRAPDQDRNSMQQRKRHVPARGAGNGPSLAGQAQTGRDKHHKDSA